MCFSWNYPLCLKVGINPTRSHYAWYNFPRQEEFELFVQKKHVFDADDMYQ